jgi:hypothetical protein
VTGRGRHPADVTTRGAVWWLTAQTLAFGFTAALVGVVANAMFLDAYGSGWLPVTYILVGGAGVAVSAGIAGASRRFDLVPIAVTVLGAITAAFVAAWLVAGGGAGAWVSGPLLVVFAILIELGFVFVGMQAGRILDIAGIKATMPRIMAGFPVGAIAGGLLAAPLVTWTGRTEGLLLPTALAQAAFTLLVWMTGRRYAHRLARPPGPRPAAASEGHGGAGRTRVLAGRFVVLILVYQVLSALGSQISDFLVMDRAAARYPASEDLARYVAGYTAAMNTVIILFLVVLAGPLMRRYGLRLGIAANPVVVTGLALVMVVVLLTEGGGSMALLLIVSATRIADLALSDGTTRTSVNAMYQVLPAHSRVEAQATVEGMGVPLAIGVSGVVILLLNLLPNPLPVTITVMVLVCAAWSWAAFALHRSYRPALVDAMRRRSALDEDARVAGSAEEVAAARRLAARGEAGAVRLALEVVAGMDRPAPLPELVALVDDPDPEVRLSALAGLAESGDESARERLTREAVAAAGSAEPSVRGRAATVLGRIDPANRAGLLAALLADADPGVRGHALSAVTAEDAAVALEPALDALRRPETAAAAALAVRGLGVAAVPALEAALEDPESAARPWLLRLVSTVEESPERDRVLVGHAAHPDPVVGLAVLEALAGPRAVPVEQATVERWVGTAAQQARTVLEVLVALAPTDGAAPGVAGRDQVLARALADELDVHTARVAAALTVRHGTAQLSGALAALRSGQGETGVAVEVVEVVVGGHVAAVALALLDPRLGAAERLDRLSAAGVESGARPGGREDAVRRVVQAPVEGGPSAWLRACAVWTARRDGALARCDLSRARCVDDPVLAEQLALVESSVSGRTAVGP